MLGIIMGVFSVIAIMALGNATESYISGEFEKIGANTFNIYNKGNDITKDEWLTIDDINLITENIPEVKNITTIAQWGGQIRIDTQTQMAFVSGVTSQYKNFSVIEMAAGRFLNNFDDTARARVVVVDDNFAKRFYNRVDITGENIKIKIGQYTVKAMIVGVISTGDDLLSSFAGEQIPVMVYMPIRTVHSITNSSRLGSIMYSLDKDVDVKLVNDKIISFLERVHRKEDIYYIQSMQDIQKLFTDMIGVVTSVLLVIAVITLIVGGIGIINILLVSVTERIREIGIRKALGAQKRDIVVQFLLESIIMTGFAGLIGIVLGILAGNLISAWIKIPPAVDIATVIASFSISVILGLIFGVYPAKKAADLDPIEALRYE
jgi:putative ABC transport system permease protein